MDYLSWMFLMNMGVVFVERARKAGQVFPWSHAARFKHMAFYGFFLCYIAFSLAGLDKA